MSSVREAFEAAGYVESPNLAELNQLRAEVKRLNRIVQDQSKDRRRVVAAYARLKQEKRAEYEWLAITAQLQNEIERLEREIEKRDANPFENQLRNAKRSREHLSVRYGRLHGALTALLDGGPGAREDAAQALLDVQDGNWVRARLDP